MPSKRDFSVQLEANEYIQLQGERFERLLQDHGRRKMFEETLQEIRELTYPAATWESFPIQNFLHERIVLEGGLRIGGGPVTRVMSGAESLVLAVCTVGSQVDMRIQRCQIDRDMFKALMLDEMATWALDKVRQELCSQLEAEARQEGLRASATLSPGESNWSLDDQLLIFALLNTEEIGITLTDSLVMVPLKSLSFIMGVGKNPLGVEGATNCDFCSMKERCAYSHRRPVSR